MKHTPRYVAPMVASAALLVGVGSAVAFIATKPEPKRVAPPRSPPRVEVSSIPRETRAAEVEALGTLVPERQVRLQPEVSGVVRKVSPRLVPGGRVREGAVLVRIDARNYRIAVEQARAQVARAEVELRLEQGRQRVAKAEWALLGDDTGGEADEELALRKPQLDNAEAALASARSVLRRAELDLSRTILRAPFDGFVQAESVDEGQRIGPEAQVATLVGTRAFWVQVSLPPSALGYVQLPSDGEPGSRAMVRSAAPGREVEREGRVIRLLGDLDPKGKMARLLVEIRDPMALGAEGAKPLLLGEVVEVRIEGRRLESVYVVPRLALREDRSVWTVRDGKLAIRHVDVVWRGKDRVFVRGDLGSVAQIVTSRIATPVDGMAVRVDGAEAPAEVD